MKFRWVWHKVDTDFLKKVYKDLCNKGEDIILLGKRAFQLLKEEKDRVLSFLDVPILLICKSVSVNIKQDLLP